MGRPRIRAIKGSAETCADPDSKNMQCFAADLYTNAAVRPDSAPSWLGWKTIGASTDEADDAANNCTGGAVPAIPGVFMPGGYPDGGLSFVLPSKSSVAKDRAKALEASGMFIDLNTRAFVAEFSMFNADTRVFTAAYFMIEMGREGYYLASKRYVNFQRVYYAAPPDYYRLALEISVLLLFAKYVLGECRQMGKRWEDDVREGSALWDDNDELEKKARKALLSKITGKGKDGDDSNGCRPMLGDVLFGKRVPKRIRDLFGIVVRPYFYEGQ